MSTLRDRLAAAAAGQAAELHESPAPVDSATPSPLAVAAAEPVQATLGTPMAAPAAPPVALAPPVGAPVSTAPSAYAAQTPSPAAPPATNGASGRLAELRPTSAQSGNGDPAKSSRRSLGVNTQDRIDELKSSVHGQLLKELGPQLYDANMDQNELESKVRAALLDVLSHQDRPLSASDRSRITQEISDDILGYGPIQPYLLDPDVSEVMVNGHDNIWLEAKGKLIPADATFADEAHLRRIIDKIVSRVGRRVDESSPMVDARLPDGSRVNAVIPPLAIDGSSLTIRKFSADPLTVHDLIRFGSLNPASAEFLDATVRGRLNVIVSGSTGAGKTTTLNVLSSFIPIDERIVTIEDAAELQLHQDHLVRLESRPSNIEGKGAVTIRDLVKNSLRMRPDRIIVGEVRDASALDMLQAMNTGHDGSICTVHSNGPRDTLARLETLVLMAGMDLPIKAIREQIASAVDMIVHQTRFKDGSRHITHITEVERMEGDVITLQDIFVYDHSAGFDREGNSRGTLKATGLRPKFLEKMEHANVRVDPMLFAVERR
jgi:pilus assembly protein CpaF